MPTPVDKYYKQVRDENPSYSDEQAWATAWTIYCKNVNPDSKSCHKHASLVGRVIARHLEGSYRSAGTVAEATFKKLKDGSWGLLVNSGSVRPGDDVLTVTKAGKREVKTVGKVIWSGNDVSICTIGTEGVGVRPTPRPQQESDEDLAEKGLIRVNGPRGPYVRRMTERERFDEFDY